MKVRYDMFDFQFSLDFQMRKCPRCGIWYFATDGCPICAFYRGLNK